MGAGHRQRKDKRNSGDSRYDRPPAPGYFVSTTALYDRTNTNPRDPRRYVDAENIPYVVLHPKALHYANLGDFAIVVNVKTEKSLRLLWRM